MFAMRGSGRFLLTRYCNNYKELVIKRLCLFIYFLVVNIAVLAKIDLYYVLIRLVLVYV